MGRGAGNLCTELITKYLNDNYSHNYNLLPILEIIDEHLMSVFIKSPWGYSVPFYIASINNCHPNYASYLLDKQTISVRDIYNILASMDDSKRTFYDREYIENCMCHIKKMLLMIMMQKRTDRIAFKQKNTYFGTRKVFINRKG